MNITHWFTFALLASSAMCWWDAGHMIVAEIAMKDIVTEIPEAGDFFESLTSVMYPMTHGKVKSLVESATWPDITKGYKNLLMNEWHFKDVFVNDTMTEMPYVDVKLETSSSIALVFNANKTLLNWMPDEIDLDGDFEKSFFLMYLLHVVGDIHQPLHSCSLLNKDFPEGDLGGNSMKINFVNNKEITNLHALWDSVLNADYNDIKHPMTEKNKKTIENEASKLMDQFPKASLSELNTHFYAVDWVKEAWNICKDSVYKNVTMNMKIQAGDAYMTANLPIIKKQLALAGYRLSKMLVKIYYAHKNPGTMDKRRKHLKKE